MSTPDETRPGHHVLDDDGPELLDRPRGVRQDQQDDPFPPAGLTGSPGASPFSGDVPPPPPQAGTRVEDPLEVRPGEARSQSQAQAQSQEALTPPDGGPTLLPTDGPSGAVAPIGDEQAPPPPPPPPSAGNLHPDPVEVTHLTADWHALSSQFVDDPQAAVRAASELVDRAIGDLRDSLADSGTDASDTERLRVAFRRYREVHEALTGI